MNMEEILEAVIQLAENDQSIPDTNVITWTNLAINRINTAVEAAIPPVTDVNATEVPQFDERYHEALVIFCVAKYRESDSSYSDASYFMAQFDGMLLDMQRDMEVPPSFKKDRNYQQIVVADEAVSAYNLTMPSGSYFDRVVVYLNNTEIYQGNYSISFERRLITLNTPLVKGDRITIQFESNSDLNSPPYQWWGQSGW